MIVFELVHSYYIFENAAVYSLRTLGFFADTNIAKEAIQFYEKKRGYRDARHGFVIKQRELVGNIKESEFYEAMIYAHDSTYENYEYTVELGLFADLKEAEKAIEKFRLINDTFYHNSDVEIEEIVNKFKLNQKYCTEGFVVEEIVK